MEMRRLVFWDFAELPWMEMASRAETGAKRVEHALAKNGRAELTVLFDGACGFCRASAARVRGLDRHGRIELLDLHDPAAAQRFPQVDREKALQWMQAVDARGRVFSGVDAWARIGLTLPGWKLLAWTLLVPGIHFVAGKIYAWVARNRYRWNQAGCGDDACALHGQSSTRGKSQDKQVR